MFLRRILIAVLVLAAIGCSTPPNKVEKAAPTSYKFGKGKPIQLMLLAPIESGDCPKGMIINLALCEDWLDSDDNVIFPAGTPFVGEITWSRAAGAVSPLINRPARLAMEVKPTKLAEGREIVWTADFDTLKPEAYEFTLENVGQREPNERVEKALSNDEKRELLLEMARSIESGIALDDLEAKMKDNPAFETLAQELGLWEFNKAVEQNGKSAKGFNRLIEAANELRAGDLSKLSGAEATLILGALEEAGNLANQITGSVRGIFKGRNIRARVGTKVTVYSVDAHTIAAPAIVIR